MLSVYWKKVKVATLVCRDNGKFEYTLIIPNLRKAKEEGLQVGTLMNAHFNGSFPEWIVDRVPQQIASLGEKEMFNWLAKTGGMLQTDRFSFEEEKIA